MASLTETSIISRKLIRYGIYFLILISSARFLFNTAKTIYLGIFPPPPPKETVVFGKLSKLPFPERDFPKNLNINIETPDGVLPTLLTQLPVYQMLPIPQNIKALEDARNIAQKLGFNQAGRPLLDSSPSVYRFTKDKVPSNLRMNIITKIFSIDYDILQNPALVQGAPPEPETAISQILSYLKSATLITPDLEGPKSHQFYKVEVDKFLPVTSQSEANLIKINFFRKNLGPKGSIISITPDYPEANVWFMFGNTGVRDIIRGEYYYYPIDESTSGTYPLLSSQEALDKLKSSNGYLVSYSSQNQNVTIRKIYLAYYDPGQFSQYYQPVVVFEGDNNFLAYVPAVKDEFYGQDNAEK